MRNGLFVPNFNAFADPHVFAELAVEAERAGWDGLYIWDHILIEDAIPIGDPWIAMAAAAVATSRIRLGPMITPIPRRHPWKLSREIVSLDHLSQGRIDFGVGIGHPPEAEYATFGHDTDARVRANKLDEGLALISGLWSGEPTSFQGDHYELGESTFLPRPVQRPRVPIWVAATWPNRRPFRRAAQWDGVFPLKVGTNHFVPFEYDGLREMMDYVEQHRTVSDPFDLVVGNDDAVGSSIDDLEDVGVTWMFYNLWDMSVESLAKVRSGPWR